MKTLNGSLLVLSIIAHNKGLKLPKNSSDPELGGINEREFIASVAQDYYGDPEDQVLPSDILSQLAEEGLPDALSEAVMSSFVGRYMRRGSTVFEVTQHILTKNDWEYYVLRDKGNTDAVKRCLVMGFSTDIGDVALKELKGNVRTNISGTLLNDIAPPQGWHWMQEEFSP